MSVLCIHGIAPDVDRNRFLHRNLVAAPALHYGLSQVPAFVSIEEALAGRGAALTIDDATRAGADAALMARTFGHAVTLFVNPGQVESGQPYHFLLLNALLDGLRGDAVTFAGTTFPAGTNPERQALRRNIKEHLRRLTSEDERRALVLDLGARWNVAGLGVGAPNATLTRSDLEALVAAGVDLQNHGWSHAHHPSLTPEESAHEIRRGRDWLRREFGSDARWFAAPFGDSLPHAVAMDCDAWFAFNSEWKDGWLAANVYNRGSLELPRRGTSLSGRAGAALRGLVQRASRLLRH